MIDEAQNKPDHLRRLAARWAEGLRGVRQRRRGDRVVRQVHVAMLGALAVADEIENRTGPERRSRDAIIADLRRLGLTFEGVAEHLQMPVGSVKTAARRVRMEAER